MVGSQAAHAARWIPTGIVATGGARDAAFSRVRRGFLAARLVVGREAGTFPIGINRELETTEPESDRPA